MQKTAFFTVLFGLLVLVSHAAAQGPKLTWTALEKKRPFYVEVVTTTKQLVTTQGTKMPTNHRLTFVYQWMPQGKKQGKYVVIQKIIGVEHKDLNRRPGCTFDGSPKEQLKEPLDKLLSSCVGTSYTLTINPKDWTVEKVVGPVPRPKPEPGTYPDALEKLRDQTTSHDSVKHAAQQILAVVPPRGFVPRKKRWFTTHTIDFGPMGKAVAKDQYIYKGKKGNLDHIEIVREVTIVPAKQTDNTPLEIVAANLKGKKITGEMFFNANKGRLERLTVPLRIEGTLKVKIAKADVDLELSLTSRVEIHVMDKNPVAKR